MSPLRALFLSLLVLLPLSLSAQREKLPPEDLEIVENEWPHARRSFTGLRWVVLKEGDGPLVKSGDRVRVLYEGRLINGKVFDKATKPENAFALRVGRGEVIQGWEEALLRMRVGARHLIIVPSDLAYGAQGSPPAIPKYATLVFEVEVLSAEEFVPALPVFPTPTPTPTPQPEP